MSWRDHGKCLFDQGRWKEGRERFLRALEIRREKGDYELVESTRIALEVIERKGQWD